MVALASDNVVLLITTDKDAFSEGRKSEEPSQALLTEAERRTGQAGRIQITLEPDHALELASQLAATAAAPERAAEVEATQEDQRVADDRGRTRLEALLGEGSFRSVLDEAVDAALQHLDLGHSLTRYGLPAIDLWSADIDIVDNLGGYDIRSVHASGDGLLLCELNVRASFEASVRMHPSSTVAIEDYPTITITDYGLASGTGEAQIALQGDVVVDVVVDPEAGTLASLATVSEIEPAGL